MGTPIVRNNVGSAVAVTSANAVASNAYANVADRLRITTSSGGNLGALLADFRLTSVTFGAAPTAGAIQLYAVDRDGSGTAGPTPASTILPRLVGTFSPQPNTGNASTGWIMALNNVPLSPDCDYYLYNNGTGQSLSAGWVLTAQPWSPGA